MIIPLDVFEKIMTFTEPTINICLACSRAKRKRRPATFLSIKSILNPTQWLIDEMCRSTIGDGVNALELSIWLSLQSGNLHVAKRYIDASLLAIDDPVLHQRIQLYRDVTARGNVGFQFDYNDCLKNGNLAYLLCAQYARIPIRNDFYIIERAIYNKRILFASYIMVQPEYHTLINMNVLSMFIRNSGTQLVRWMIEKVLGECTDTDFVMTNLVTSNNIEAFKYFRDVQGYPVTDDVLECANIHSFSII
jgi:hypothetical protein